MTSGGNDLNHDIALDLDHRLIASDRVEGTRVFDEDGHKLGRIRCLMIDKTSGQVVLAVIAFGSYFEIERRVHPIPWAMLHYDPQLRGYVVTITRDQLNEAPTLHIGLDGRPTDQHLIGLEGYDGIALYWPV